VTATRIVTPTGELVGTYTPGTPEWQAARAGSITATRIAAVLGLSPWDSPFSLWHKLAGTVSDAVDQSPEMEWGIRLEPVVRAKFADEHPEFTMVAAGTFRHAARTWQRCTPDGLLVPPCDCGYHQAVGCCDADCAPCCPTCPTCPLNRRRATALFEAKTSPYGEGWGPAGSDEIPIYYRAQVLWQLDTVGLDMCHVAVLIGGCDYREFEIPAEPDEAAYMRDRARAFLDSIDAGKRPAIDGHEQTYRVVKQLPDGVEDDSVDVGPLLADRYRTAGEVAKAAAAELSEARSLLLDRMGNSLRAEALGERIAYRTTHPDGTTRALQPARGRNRSA